MDRDQDCFGVGGHARHFGGVLLVFAFAFWCQSLRVKKIQKQDG
jgi:hypothetical protein